MDATSRGDVCWSSFVVLPSVLLGILNVINIPYILSGGTRGVIGEGMDLDDLAIKHREEDIVEVLDEEPDYSLDLTGNKLGKRYTRSSLMRESLDYSGIELKDMTENPILKRSYSDRSNSSDVDGGVVEISVKR